MPFPQTMELVEALETEMARLKFLAQHAEVGIGDIRDRWGVYFSVPEMPHQETENVETAFLAAIDSAREREKGNPT